MFVCVRGGWMMRKKFLRRVGCSTGSFVTVGSDIYVGLLVGSVMGFGIVDFEIVDWRDKNVFVLLRR